MADVSVLHLARENLISPANAEAATLAVALRSVGGGNHDAFEEVYRRTAVKLRSVCLRILSGRDEAEEVVQDVYLSVWHRAAAFDEGRGTAMTWLITLARNRAVDRLRRNARMTLVPIDWAANVADAAPSISHTLEEREQLERLAYFLATMDGPGMCFIRTACLEGLTHTELAQRATLPLGTVKSQVRRSMQKLRLCLQ